MRSASRETFLGQICFLIAILITIDLRADVKLPSVISDHMVLQQGMPVPIWGTASPGEKITVTFGADHEQTIADAAGKWLVKLKPLTASSIPADLTISDAKTIVLRDILVGEVWVCSGQSNMRFPTSGVLNAAKEIADCDHPNIRLFTLQNAGSDEPQYETHGNWVGCSPQTVPGFSAVGFFFGRDLQQRINVPIGLIHTSWNGTVAEAWTAPAGLKDDPDFAPILDRASKVKLGDPNGASKLWNTMVVPIIPFAIKGVVWYQGESNAGRGYQYRKLLPALIKTWRDGWGEGDFDFYIVSLASYQNIQAQPAESDWAELREAQAMTAAMPHNGLALAIDLGDPVDIHPKNGSSAEFVGNLFRKFAAVR